jgi:hypothetical protein
VIVTAQKNVGTAATQLTTSDADGYGSVIVQNVGSASVFLGGSGVTTLNGFELKSGASFTADLAGEQLFAVAASGSVAVHVLEVGR